MCMVCGCSTESDTRGHEGAPDHQHDNGHDGRDHEHHEYDHDHDHDHTHDHAHRRRHPIDASLRPLYPADEERRAQRLIRVEQDILGENKRFAAANRAWLHERSIVALNVMSGPGAGKTTLLVKLIDDLCQTWPIAVIEGDQETTFDADRVRAAGVPARQINTGKGCHLDARMVAGALADLDPVAGSLLLIENVGNLVCPAAFDLGELAKVVLLSVTEGEDKPLKYAEMFHAADVMLLTKMDLLPFVKFDCDRCRMFARRVNPRLVIFEVSAFTGVGLSEWYAWLRARADAQRPRTADVAARGGTGAIG